MSWSVLTAQEENAWFEDYVGVVIGSAPDPLPPKFQTFGSTDVSWWEGPPGKAIVMSKGGSFDDRHLAEQIVVHDLSKFGYSRAQFTLNDNAAWRKTAGWDEVQAKGARLKNGGRVTILRNGWNAIVSNVVGDHGEYECTISRDDPNSMAITQWTCECPWDQYAFNRTRKWKYLEGRCCSHVLATMWQALATPIDDYDPNTHGPLPRGQKKSPPGGGQGGPPSGGGGGGGGGGGPAGPAGPRSFNPDGTVNQGPTNEIGTGGGIPKGFDVDDESSGGTPPTKPTEAPAMTIGPSAAPATTSPNPVIPTPPGTGKIPKPSPSRGQGQGTDPLSGQGPALNSLSQPTTEFDVIPDQPGQPGQQPLEPFSQPKGEDQTGGRNIHLPGALSKVIGKSFRHVRHAAEIFEQDEVVQLLPPNPPVEGWGGEYGVAVGGAPGYGTGEMVLVGPNSVGTVFSYDESLDWITVHFPLHKSGELQPHFAECILPSEQLAKRPDVKNPFKGRR